jgi:glycosyltransferase involved in cell wall biosynthesis
MRLCFVTHRAAPFPGGTESFIQNMAEAALARGHDVTIVTGQHRGDLNGVRVTSDEALLTRETFDLIAVHGATEGPPRRTLERAPTLPGPVLYMLVAHDARHVRSRHLQAATLLGWSTPLDRSVIARAGLTAREVRARHGIPVTPSLGQPGFRARYAIAPERRMFVSCGGYSAHKRMRALARLFTRTQGNSLLVTTGYAPARWSMPRRGPRVLPLVIEDHAEVLSAIAEADCYLMHSRNEGFGLVLLEAMLNRTPWIAHETGGATVLAAHGSVYRRDTELVALINGFRPEPAATEAARQAMLEAHRIEHCVDDLEEAAQRARAYR